MYNVLNLAKRRISIRNFLSEPIDLRDVLYALDAARNAPSGANKQPWRFIIVTDNELKKKIRSYCEDAEKEFHSRAPEWMKSWLLEKGITWRKEFLTQAPVLIMVFGKTKEPYWVQSVWLAIGYLLLALEERGLASLTYTPPKVSWANKLLAVPTDYMLQVIIPVGRAKESKRSKERLGLEHIAYCNKWGHTYDLCLNGIDSYKR